MTDTNVSDLPEFTATTEATTVTPTGQLRFLYTQLPDGRVDIILQQEIATLSYRDGKAYAQSLEWRDVPCISGN